MTKEERSKLKALAEKATPGPWCADIDIEDGEEVVYSIQRAAYTTDIVRTDAGAYPPKVNDARYIAACSPDKVLSLLDLLDHYEKNNELIRELLK